MESSIRFLEDAHVFNGMDSDSLRGLSGLFQPRTFRRGQTVVHMGDDSDAVFLIEDGECKVSIPFDFNMGENILSFLKTGELFGEMGVITGNRRTANISCTTDVRLLAMSAEDFWAVTEAHPVVLKNIIAILSDRLVAQNEGRGHHQRAPLNLSGRQRRCLVKFHQYIDAQSRALVESKVPAGVPVRAFSGSFRNTVRGALQALADFFVGLAARPYVNAVNGLEHVPADRPAIFVLNFRSVLDLFLFSAAHRRTSPGRRLVLAVQVGGIGKWRLFFLRGLLWGLRVCYLAGDPVDPRRGSEDAVGYLNRPGSPDTLVDVALHPFRRRAMRYDTPLTGEHLNIWLDTNRERCIVPVALTGTDKFWPFEPWPRRFFSFSAFFKLRSVSISVGEAIRPSDANFGDDVDACRGDREKIRQVFDRANRMIGARLASLEGQQYQPVSDDGGMALLRDFNDMWSNRLSLMLPVGLSLRKKYRKASVRIRHFMWHAEMLNVVLTHFEGEGYVLPPWAKGMLIAGTSYADVSWPYFSMDHSYNPYNGKGMKLIFRFPDLMSLIRTEIDGLMAAAARDDEIDGVLGRLGRIYHYMSDLAIPAHVHNIPHMFINLPKIGKCDFEEYLGMDRPLMVLNSHDIGDISAVSVASFDEFYASLEHIARYTFLSSSFSVEQMAAIARDRMITEVDDIENLIEKLNRVGVSAHRVEGYEDEERYYVRNLTSRECEDISGKTILYSLKTIAACFIFLIGAVMERVGKPVDGRQAV